MLRTRDQIYADLSAKLDSKHVKARSQSGRTLSYIEGWHAIAEANRIFGFDGWTRETVELHCVAENQRKVGTRGDAGHGVSYFAKVRITALGVTREGCGIGHGIDRDQGIAHESAIKEAETDAMKRALMTFGNPFGLALYDKTQANVADDVAVEPAPENPPAPLPETIDDDGVAPERRLRKGRPPRFDDMKDLVRGAKDFAEMQLALGKPYFKNTISDWSNYWIRQLIDNHVVPKIAEFRGSEVALEMQGNWHKRYPVEEVREAAE